MARLTVKNFVSRVKEMDEIDRKRLGARELIELILLLPENDTSNQNLKMNSLVEETVNSLVASVEFVRTQSIQNAAEILNLSTRNAELARRNEDLTTQLTQLNENRLSDRYDEQICQIENHLSSIEKHLRINNHETEEANILEAINSVEGQDDELRKCDIDIRVPPPPKRRDKKRVSVVRFISRMTKLDVLSAKIQNAHRYFKFRSNELFIKEHLTPEDPE